jgi:hypothetical protein
LHDEQQHHTTPNEEAASIIWQELHWQLLCRKRTLFTMPTSVDPDVARKLEVHTTLLFCALRAVMTYFAPQDFKHTVTAAAEDIVFRVFPSKVRHLWVRRTSQFNTIFLDPVS